MIVVVLRCSTSFGTPLFEEESAAYGSVMMSQRTLSMLFTLNSLNDIRRHFLNSPRCPSFRFLVLCTLDQKTAGQYLSKTQTCTTQVHNFWTQPTEEMAQK